MAGLANSTATAVVGGTTSPQASGSFTPLAGEYLVVGAVAGSSGSNAVTIAITDSQSGTWTSGPFANLTSPGGGGGGGAAGLWARRITTAASMTVTATASGTGVNHCGLQVWRVRGEADLTFGASGTGQASATLHITPVVFTSQINNSTVFAVVNDWSGGGTLTSADLTFTAFTNANSEGGFGYKATPAVPGSTSIDVTLSGTTGGHWYWVAWEIADTSAPALPARRRPSASLRMPSRPRRAPVPAADAPIPRAATPRPRPALRPIRARSASPAPPQAVVPPAWVPLRRAPLRVLQALRRRRGDADGPLAGQDLPSTSASRRRPLLRRRPAAVTPVPVQVFAGPAYPVRPSSPRRMGRRLARPSTVTPVPVQIVPPPPWVPQWQLVRRVVAGLRRQRGDTTPPMDQAVPGAITAPRRWRGPWRRRPAAVGPVPLQVFAGPSYPPAPTNPRRMGRLSRRARAVTPVPAQLFVGPAFIPQKAGPRRVLLMLRRQRGDTAPPVDQAGAPASSRPRLRPLLRRRPASTTVPPGQASPAWVLTRTAPRRALAALLRRQRGDTAPPVDQATPATGALRRPRAPWRRRPVTVTPAPTQGTPPRPGPARHPAAALFRPRRSATPAVPQAAPPVTVKAARSRLGLRRGRPRTAAPPRPQDSIPAYPVRPSSPRRVLASIRGLRRLTPRWVGVARQPVGNDSTATGPGTTSSVGGAGASGTAAGPGISGSAT